MDSGSELQANQKMEVLIDDPGFSTNIETAGACTESEAKPMHCESNCEDSVFDMENSVDVGRKGKLNDETVEVDITNEGAGTADTVDIKEPLAGRDSTENSSSFSGTLSGTENTSALSDGEIESQNLDGNVPGYYFTEFYEGFTMRKKRLTDHWIRFIHPLKWRCRWLELQIKEFQAQALEYDKELKQYEETKQHLLESFMAEDFNSRSLAFSGQLPKMNVMKRRKRKRIEENVDIASYMSNHNLFSYYGLIFTDFPTDIYSYCCKRKGSVVRIFNLTVYFALADKRISAERSLTKDGNGNRAMTNCMPSLGGDDSLHLRDADTSMEQMLAKIVMVQSQIHQLKTRIEKVISENPGKFSSVNRLSLAAPGSEGNISDEEPASPAANGQLSSIKSLYAASSLALDGDDSDLLLPNQPISEHLGITALPDVVESTKKIEDGGHMNNQMAEEELLDSGKVGERQDMKPEKRTERQKKMASSTVVPEAAQPGETPCPLDTSNVKSRPSLKTYISNNKRKRRRRGAAARKKTKRLPG